MKKEFSKNTTEVFAKTIFHYVLITTLKYIRKHENYLYKKTQ